MGKKHREDIIDVLQLLEQNGGRVCNILSHKAFYDFMKKLSSYFKEKSVEISLNLYY